ncbi:VOC family protein [Alkalibacter rhizosphaerae]|uniref:VOC family protein n=1 Tax=Alkalibacter rhizosphaerae TaxID=2815577 RepID=A0A975AH99_9FIRM|nr:VOC family protein [Alkalibacter rhizosphaerae]QSX08227.1 VOC family protein [Alkalibacter rhizosphaerae]
MNKIIPHLWYDKEAKEAAVLYTKAFRDSRIMGSTILRDTPSGDTEIVDFELMGTRFQAISAGPYFTFNPSISLMVSLNAKEEVERLWSVLSEGGEALMPLQEYPFSKLYGWVKDKFGLTWQLMFVEDEARQKIKPSLLFSNGVCGLAEEAVRFYLEVFEDSSIAWINHYREGEAQDKEARVNFAAFTLSNMEMVAMDNGMGGDFTFTEAFSLIVFCKNQLEIDYYWEKLSADPAAEQCGWIKDKYGLSWQIIPEGLDELLVQGSEEEISRATKAFLQMKKIDLKELERVRKGS